MIVFCTGLVSIKKLICIQFCEIFAVLPSLHFPEYIVIIF